MALSKTGSKSIQLAINWIYANPDWEKELSKDTDQSESTSDNQPANQLEPFFEKNIPSKEPLSDEEIWEKLALQRLFSSDKSMKKQAEKRRKLKLAEAADKTCQLKRVKEQVLPLPIL